MSFRRSHLVSTAVFVVTLALVWIAASFSHELGHGLTAEVLGGRFLWFYVWPGVKVYPHPGQPFEGEWGTSIAKAAYATGPGWGHWQNGLTLLMGSGVNLVLAALALGALWLFQPGGWLQFLLVAEVLMLEDILLYATLPELFGLRHYVVFGGVKPEPVNGAELMGCPRLLCVVLVVLVSALMLWALVVYLRRERGADTG